MDERKTQRWDQVFYRLEYVDLRDGLGEFRSALDYRSGSWPSRLRRRFPFGRALKLAYVGGVVFGSLVAAYLGGL